MFRVSIYRSYPDLFDFIEEKLEKNDKGNTESNAVSWYRILINLADQNPLELSRATKLGVKESFNFITWKYHEDKKQEMESKKLVQKYNTQR